MTLLSSLADPEVWERFYKYKADLSCHKTFLKTLRSFIDRRGFIDVCEKIGAGVPFPLPEKSVVSKLSTGKKRVVYTYPDDENTVLKLLTWLLTRKYDAVFSKGLYSFRPGRTAKDAFRSLSLSPGIGEKYAYKADVGDYFNSVPVERFLPVLEDTLSDDPETFRFLRRLLEEPEVLDKGKRVREQKGIMAGTPLSAFYANLYLADLDRAFAGQDVPYARYSDDVIVFGDTREQAEEHAAAIRAALAEKGLRINPDKESFFAPEEGFVFLGFCYCKGVTDVSPVSVTKLKKKMRRKTRALSRWAKRNGLPGEKAAKGFVNAFNRKLYEGGKDNELTWALWFFPVITTDVSLRDLDRCAEDCIRYLVSGTRTKARFNVRYADVKALGFRSLVHEYYLFINRK